jgi:molybdopterin converting factor small subunit
MKVKIKFFTFFGNLCRVDKTEFCLHRGATVKDTLEKIADDFPKLKKWLPQYVWVFIRGNYANLRTQLKNDDEIALFPPIAGG